MKKSWATKRYFSLWGYFNNCYTLGFISWEYAVIFKIIFFRVDIFLRRICYEKEKVWPHCLKWHLSHVHTKSWSGYHIPFDFIWLWFHSHQSCESSNIQTKWHPITWLPHYGQLPRIEEEKPTSSFHKGIQINFLTPHYAKCLPFCSILLCTAMIITSNNPLQVVI